jgi:outer membrane receptor for ferrienterochelin and colicins
MHIAFAGGRISRIVLAPDLKGERSYSLSGSVNYDHATATYIVGFTMDGFFTRLDDAFFLQPAGNDFFGDIFEKQNGSGASVQGGTLELRGNYNKMIQIEAGFTLQTSLFDDPVEHIEGEAPKREFLRTPNRYGYLSYSFTPGEKFNASFTGIYTGPMQMVHFAGAPEQTFNAYVTSPDFFDLNFKAGYTFRFEMVDSGLQLFAGIKNITNAYQDDFDTGKHRDSGYVYGPAAPRTYFLGLRIRSF